MNRLDDVMQQCSSEYQKVYGRWGTNPLLAVKGAKRPPRYLLDRDEVWLIYKPPPLSGSLDSQGLCRRYVPGTYILQTEIHIHIMCVLTHINNKIIIIKNIYTYHHIYMETV